MPGHSSLRNVGIEKLVEKQMRNWGLARSQRVTPPDAEPPEVEPFVAISRPVGSDGLGGANIPAAVGERLGWPVFDKEILHAMSADDRIREQLYANMDERDLSWFEESVRALMHGEFKKNDYFRRLTETVLAIARQGRTVFVGRAADLILPRDRGLCVRLSASRTRCLENYARQKGADLDQAREEVEQIERERAEFVEHHFKIKPGDPARHDLTINLDRFTPQQAVELILTTLKMRGIVPE